MHRKLCAVGGHVVVDGTAENRADHSHVVQGQVAAVIHIEGCAAVCGDGEGLRIDGDLLADVNGSGQGYVSDQLQSTFSRSCIDGRLKVRVSPTCNDCDRVVGKDITFDHTSSSCACIQNNALQVNSGVGRNAVILEGGSSYSDVHVDERHCYVAGQDECLIQVCVDGVLTLSINGQVLVQGDRSSKSCVSKQGDGITFSSIVHSLYKGVIEVDLQSTRTGESIVCDHSGTSAVICTKGNKGICTGGVNINCGSIQTLHRSGRVQGDLEGVVSIIGCGYDCGAILSSNAILAQICPISINDRTCVQGNCDAVSSRSVDLDRDTATGNDRIGDG